MVTDRIAEHSQDPTHARCNETASRSLLRSEVIRSDRSSGGLTTTATTGDAMDVLSGSIDVREILPGDALDESSPLSAPDLRLLIDRLQIRSLRIKDKVRSYVLAHREDFYDLFSLCSSASSSVEGLSRSLSDALGLLSDRPLDLEIEALVSEIRDKRRELVERRDALEVVRTLSAIHSQLMLAREDLRCGRLVAAAEAVGNLRKGMIFGGEKDNGDGVDEPAVFRFLRKDWSECFDEVEKASPIVCTRS